MDQLYLLALFKLPLVEFQIHDLEFCLDPQILVKETLPALESVVKAGKAKYIGITSYSLEAMKSTIEASPVKIDSLLSYSRMNFNDTSLLDYLPFLQVITQNSDPQIKFLNKCLEIFECHRKTTLVLLTLPQYQWACSLPEDLQNGTQLQKK